jgi:pimeloyl-ACP methyl ester carboxylesterase
MAMTALIDTIAAGGGAVDEGGFLEIHGGPQWVTFRGRDRANPALLLIGGPGAAFSACAEFFAPWESELTIVQWDQPGAGATHAKNGAGDSEPLTIERLARDGIAVATAACRALRRRTIGLLCASGGTMVGLTMIARRPRLFGAYVGTGQIVDWLRQDASSYERLVAAARARGDQSTLAELEQIGPPPYRDTATDAVKSKYAGAPTAAEQRELATMMQLAVAAFRNPATRFIAHGLPFEDVRARATAAYDALRPDIVGFDARRLGHRFDVPLCVFQGAADAFTVTSEVERWLAAVEAPSKRLELVPGAGHSALFLREPMLELLRAHVRQVLVDAG